MSLSGHVHTVVIKYKYNVDPGTHTWSNPAHATSLPMTAPMCFLPRQLAVWNLLKQIPERHGRAQYVVLPQVQPLNTRLLPAHRGTPFRRFMFPPQLRLATLCSTCRHPLYLLYIIATRPPTLRGHWYGRTFPSPQAAKWPCGVHNKGSPQLLPACYLVGTPQLCRIVCVDGRGAQV